VVRLALPEGAWSRVPDGFSRTRSVFTVRWCGFMSVSSDLRLSPLTIDNGYCFGAGSLGAYHDDFPFIYYDKFSDSGDGGARTTARWSEYLFVISTTFQDMCTIVGGY
jgi:hypothetical protein